MTTYTGAQHDLVLGTGFEQLDFAATANTVSNSYAVTGNSAGTSIFANYGRISAQYAIGGRIREIDNYGDIFAAGPVTGAIAGLFDVLENSGRIIGSTTVDTSVGVPAGYTGSKIFNNDMMENVVVFAHTTTFDLENAGTMSTDAQAVVDIYDCKKATVNNSGSLLGATHYANALTGISFANLTAEASVINTGTISAYFGIRSAAVIQSYENYNAITGRMNAFVLSGGAATIYNSGTITGQTNTAIKSTTALSITNDGTIRGKSFAIEASDAIDTIVNNGLISGSIKLAGGADVYDGTFGRVTGTIDLGDGTNTATGGAYADTIVGGADGDTIDGGSGNDTMAGGVGNDVYYVDNARDRVIEAVGGGLDTVVVRANYVLTAGQEIESIVVDGAVGALAINITGNEFANDIWGNEETNRLIGGGGNDTLRGYGGTDYFDGGDGFDTVSFTTSTNGAGIIVNLTAQGSNGGYATGTILNSVEGVIGTRYDDIITGNDDVNEFYGLIGNDRLDGKAGADRLYGGAGNDTYYVDVAGDLAVEVEGGIDQGGNDIIYSSATFYAIGTGIEGLRLLGTTAIDGDGNGGTNTIYGNTAANILRGLAGVDTIHGGGGADTLVGGTERDTLFGEGGADTFRFAAGDSGNNATTYDLVQDFKESDGDSIDLDVVGTGGVTLTDANYAERTVASDAFGTAQSAASAAMADGLHNAVFVAGTTVGWLFWNTDSNMQTPDQAMRLAGVNNVGLFARTDIS